MPEFTVSLFMYVYVYVCNVYIAMLLRKIRYLAFQYFDLITSLII